MITITKYSLMIIKIKNMLLCVLSFFLAGCSVFGISNVEEARYKTLDKDNNYSLREYDKVMIAEVTVDGDHYNDTSRKSFRILFNYISGDNKTKLDIPMTSPVINQSNKKIKMTSPVLTNNQTMVFFLPSHFTLKNTPIPNNPRVKVYMRKPKVIGVVKFNGRMTNDAINKYTKLLSNWLKMKGYKELSKPIYARYNPPWTLPIFRHNEIQIIVEKD